MSAPLWLCLRPTRRRCSRWDTSGAPITRTTCDIPALVPGEGPTLCQLSCDVFCTATGKVSLRPVRRDRRTDPQRKGNAMTFAPVRDVPALRRSQSCAVRSAPAARVVA